MPGFRAGSHFGQDGPARVAQAADMLMEASEMAPVPQYQQLVSFLPADIVSGDAASSITSGVTGSLDSTYKQYADRLDLYIWQGDDLVIPLYFKDPNQPDLDMSTWEWKAQVRTRHRYNARWVYDFIEVASHIQAIDTDDGLYDQTLVQLVLPRQVNAYRGVFEWELHSTSPWTGPDMTGITQPDEVWDDTQWPPTEQVKTWLYGRLYVVPRLNSTDTLPIPAGAIGNGSVLWVTPQGWTAGPNGRVP